MLDPYIGAYELRELVRRKEVRPREVAEFFLARVERLNPRLGAFMTITGERALADAERLERIGEAERAALPLFGVAYSLKDLTWTQGIRTTMGSKNFEHYVPEVDQEYAARIAAAGGILLGKTTTPEFGGRPTTEGGLCPAAHNPWNLEFTAGGSSCGAAGAVAAGLGPIAEGSDGGGSIRIPRSCCGLVGIKPARGRVSFAPAMRRRLGRIRHGRANRAVGARRRVAAGRWRPVAGDLYWRRHRRTVRRRSHATSTEAAAAAIAPVRSRRSRRKRSGVGRTGSLTFRGEMGRCGRSIALDPRGVVERQAVYDFAGVGSIPLKDLSSVDPVVRSLWERGRAMSAAEYIGTISHMHNTAREIVRALMPFDALITPTLTSPPMRLGAPHLDPAKYADDFFGWIAFTFPFNATGQPALSVPNGFTKAGLPIGLQIVGRPADEPGIIALAAAREEARPWAGRRPPLD
jgi:amidase